MHARQKHMPEWEKVALGEVLEPVPASRRESVDSNKQYRLLGVRLNNEGPFLRETKMGAESSAPSLFRVQTGDFIYSRLFAWRGALGLIPPELDGCFVSNEFPLFVAKDDRIDLQYLDYWFHLPDVVRAIEADCTGSTPLTRNRYKEVFFLALQIPLPPLPEQRRIVARVQGLLAKVEEVRGLNEHVKLGQIDLLQALAYRSDLSDEIKLKAGWKQMKLAEILHPAAQRETVRADGSYPNFGIYSFGRGLFEKPDISGMDTSAQSLYRVRAGQFIYSRLFAFEGAYGVVRPEFDGYYISNEYPAFDIDPDLATPAFLQAYFSRRSLWPQLAAGSKGLGDRRQRIQPDQILAHELLLPPLHLQQELKKAAAISAQTSSEAGVSKERLDALPSSILARAFAGAL